MAPALLIAHPGHEIRVHHWMERSRPIVFVLTDGSGGGGVPRTESTRRIVNRCGATAGTIFARFTDKALYDVIREGRIDELIGLAADLADAWQRLGIDTVVADMLEGFNTSHDVCRFIAGAAVERMRRAGRNVRNLDFPLEGLPDRLLPLAADAEVIRLDQAAFERKRSAAMEYDELRTEVERAIAACGEEPFKREVLRPAPQPAGLTWDGPGRPYYEIHGAKMVAAGRYRDVITYERHLQPIAAGLWAWAVR